MSFLHAFSLFIFSLFHLRFSTVLFFTFCVVARYPINSGDMPVTLVCLVHMGVFNCSPFRQAIVSSWGLILEHIVLKVSIPVNL